MSFLSSCVRGRPCADVQTRTNARPCVKQALLHIKFALHGDSFSFLFIRRFDTHAHEKEKHGPREIRGGTIAPRRRERAPGARRPPAAAGAALHTREIRDSQDRRNIADRKPTEKGVLDNAAPFPGVGHGCFNMPRFCSRCRARDNL